LHPSNSFRQRYLSPNCSKKEIHFIKALCVRFDYFINFSFNFFISLGVAVSSVYLSLKVAFSKPKTLFEFKQHFSCIVSDIEVTLGPLTALPLVKLPRQLLSAACDSFFRRIPCCGYWNAYPFSIAVVGGKIGKGERINWSTTGSTVAPAYCPFYKDGSFLLAHGGEVLSANVLNKGVGFAISVFFSTSS
jgi:hypothetical protein